MKWNLFSLCLCYAGFVGFSRGINFELQGTINVGKNVRTIKGSRNAAVLETTQKGIGRQGAAGDLEVEGETEKPTLIIPRPRNISATWMVGPSLVPNTSVQAHDYIFNMPSDPDVDLITEGKRVRLKLLYAIGELMFKIRNENPDKNSPMMKVILRAWRIEYIKELDKMVDSLERTKNLRYREKMQIWVEFLSKAEAIFKKVSVKYINAIIPTIPKSHPKWIKKRKKIEKAQKYGFFRTMENFKTTEFRALCKKFGNCVFTKTFWDYVADWLAQVLRASPTKRKEFFVALVGELKPISYSAIIEPGLFDHVRSYIDNLSDSTDFKYIILLSLVHESIVSRYKPILDSNPIVLKQTKLFRIIMLIIDKAYQSYDDDEEWKKITKQTRRWRIGIRAYIGELILEVIDNFYEEYESWNDDYQKLLEDSVNGLIRSIVKDTIQLARLPENEKNLVRPEYDNYQDEYDNYQDEYDNYQDEYGDDSI